MPLNRNRSMLAEKDESNKLTTSTPEQENIRPAQTISRENVEKSIKSRKRAPEALFTFDGMSTSEPEKRAKKKVDLIITLPFKIRDLKFGKAGYCSVKDGEILRNRFKIKRMVGSGSYGSVHLAEEKHTKRTVALKVARSGEFFNSAADMEIGLLKEAKDVLKSSVSSKTPVGSSNIVWLLGDFKFTGSHGIHVVLVMESLGPDLFTILRYSNQKMLTLHRIKRFLKNILEGLYFLHSFCKIMHLDLKPENCLVRLDPKNMDLSDPNCSARLKIGDFGTSARTNEIVRRTVQTSPFRAPESFLKAQITPAADIWSVGCTMYEMATRRMLFPSIRGITCDHKWYLCRISKLLGPIKKKYFERDDQNVQIYEEVFGNQEALNEKPLYTNPIFPDELKKKCSMSEPDAEEFLELLTKLLTIDPKKRLTAEAALQHHFFLGIPSK